MYLDMKTSILLLIIIFAGAFQANAAEISNFKAGLICSDGKDFIGVCHTTEDIYITGQSTCVFNKEYKPCTWYGFSFDYAKVKPQTELLCKYKTSQNIMDGNPKEIRSDSTNSGEYTIKLEGESGHFFNPQYFLFAGYRKLSDSTITTETVCSIEGKEVFKYKIKAHFPVK
jgi:hypothetical protein